MLCGSDGVLGLFITVQVSEPPGESVSQGLINNTIVSIIMAIC